MRFSFAANTEKEVLAMLYQELLLALLDRAGDSDSDRWRVVRPNMDKERCTDCGVCIEACPMATICADGTVIRIRYEGCIGCGICAVNCRIHAIQMEPSPDWRH